MRITTISAALLGLTALSACERPEAVLTGERLGVHEVLEGGSAEATPANRAAPVSVGAATGGLAAQSPVSPFARSNHAALSLPLQQVFATSIGSGDGKRARLNVDPVAAGGRIFTMDSGHTVSAVGTNGSVLWQKSMVPSRDQAKQAQGGGLAVEGNRLYVASGFGKVTALDAATGAEVWTQQLGGTATGAPTVRGGLVYLTSGDSVGWAIEADTGRVRWRIDYPEDYNNVAGAPAPALDGEIVVFAFGSGAVQAAFRQGGLRRWSADVAGSRTGSALATITDITGDPLISNGKVYVGNHSGRVVALSLASGERLWTARMGALDAVWPVGDSVYLVSDQNQLVRLDADTGAQIWAVDLPGYEPVRRPQKRRDSAFVHHGPILAGGRLIVASSDGVLRAFDPASGQLVGTTQIEGGATTRPIVSGGTLYVVSGDGTLHGYR
ncbi:PQQ-like beta-propeller repeat protein [Salipiger sp. PrR002]|uniref:outer membrane protein assembly factor BamB family protein n=1 Tax=Salipiger sp. PrR002 TaxID=2706489 RepID=UPI0013B87AF5|nr:PQQ-like beta-propeller repeat protein [Salipiger sp. PrR002]NDW01011.1 PQQ-binding-like beta-propeller repeat protein [Salipiger sp. PrR002]NDW59601.1 PQQ-binding-like beta-propeller repeat protein [Salipiger sp. PrR004]